MSTESECFCLFAYVLLSTTGPSACSTLGVVGGSHIQRIHCYLTFYIYSYLRIPMPRNPRFNPQISL